MALVQVNSQGKVCGVTKKGNKAVHPAVVQVSVQAGCFSETSSGQLV